MSKITVRKSKKHPYLIMDKTGLQDGKLSWKAKGILAYLLSLPDDRQVYITELVKHSKDWRDSTSAGIKELMENWYIVRSQTKGEKGKFDWYDYDIYEKPVTGNPLTDKPKTGKQTLLSNNNTSNNNTEIVTNVTTPDGEWSTAIISKEKWFWNKIINETIETVKTACKEFWMIYAPGPNAEERKYAKHLSDPAFAERIQQFNMDLGTFIKNIIKMWSVLQYAKPVNNAKNIYYNRPDIVDKTQKEKLKSDSSTKWVVHLS